MTRSKPEHEEAMEAAKEMLDKGVGMGKIKETTELTEHDIIKAKHKMKRESNY